jgi:hypothetical protein
MAEQRPHTKVFYDSIIAFLNSLQRCKEAAQAASFIPQGYRPIREAWRELAASDRANLGCAELRQEPTTTNLVEFMGFCGSVVGRYEQLKEYEDRFLPEYMKSKRRFP